MLVWAADEGATSSEVPDTPLNLYPTCTTNSYCVGLNVTGWDGKVLEYNLRVLLLLTVTVKPVIQCHTNTRSDRPSHAEMATCAACHSKTQQHCRHAAVIPVACFEHHKSQQMSAVSHSYTSWVLRKTASGVTPIAI